MFHKDGFRIEIEIEALHFINITIFFPCYFCFFHEWVGNLSSIPTKIWKSKSKIKIWRHKFWNCGFHSVNVPLGKEQISTTGMTVFEKGLVHAMTMARQFIQTVRHLEQKAAMSNARQRLAVFEQELLCKALHPRRVSQWISQGFDLFFMKNSFFIPSRSELERRNHGCSEFAVGILDGVDVEIQLVVDKKVPKIVHGHVGVGRLKILCRKHS